MGRRADHPTNPDVDLVSGRFWGDDPYPALAWMREHAPVYWDDRGQVWGIAAYDDLKHVSRTPEVWSSAGGIRPSTPALPMMIDMDDPQHWQRRKLVNRGFTPRMVRDQAGKIQRVCDDLIDRVCERGACDFVWDIAAPLPLIMIGDALGVAPEDRDDLMTWSDDMMRALVGVDDADGTALVRAAEAFGAYSDYAGRVVAARRDEPRDDLMSVLVHAEVDGDRLDRDSLVHESLLILIGGDETTRHVLSGGMFQLCAHPDQWDALVTDRSLLPGAVEEMLRWVSPIKNMARTAVADVDYRGQTMAAGDKVLLLYPSANRDAAAFPEPDRFDIRRQPNEHVAFGFGPHFCLGNSLARLELTTMFDRLADRLPDLRLAPGISAEDDLDRRAANFVSGYERMPVEFTPAAPVGAAAR
jgi:cytochrome P450 family 142 subfamily A polypeptide 1